MVGRTRAEAEATREALLDAAEIVFYDKGVARASLQDIARQAGLTRGALYWHFEGKADLFRALLERVRMPFEELVEAIPDHQPAENELDEIRLACLQGLERLERPHYRRVHAILFHRCEFFADINPVAMLSELSRESIASTLPRFQAAEAAGELRNGLAATTANELLHSTLRGLIHGWHLDTEAYSLVEVGSDLINQWFRLIASRA